MAAFSTFDSYKLTGVRVTDRKLGRGSYATVLELEYMGLKCAGKKIHEQLLRQGDSSYTVRRFEEECRLLSKVRHPNIVQFLGVYFQQGEQLPILVMEFLPTNLTSCIKQYGILPKEISYSILHDVALGLWYLHSQTPPIIHRDLSSNNVLLTPNMTAKISDLGVARILNLTPLQVSDMTQTPGTPAYMPPEVMVANPKYDTSVDGFSYGIMMIHMFSGRWPEPQVGQIHTEPDGRMIPVSEAERREVFLQAIGNDHPLMDLILKCIHNYPQSRAHASEIVKRTAEMVLQFPTSTVSNQLKQVTAHEEEKRTYKEELLRKGKEIIRKDEEIQELQAKLQLTSKISILWKQCAELLNRLSYGKTTVINGKVYCGGGTSDNDDEEYIIYCYDPSQDKWTTLLPLPMRYFGLGQVNGKLVAIGGQKSDCRGTSEVYTYDEISRMWKQIIPPMPTARSFPGVLSVQSALVVAGGFTSESSYTATIEIFKLDTSQWYRTDTLPIHCSDISMVAIDNICYALGGFNGSRLNQALYASVDDLFGNVVPADLTTHPGSDTQSAWKTLPNTPTYLPGAAVLAGNLLAIAGKETSDLMVGTTKKEVYMYSPSANSWIYISDLPAPRSSTAVAVLSSTEILVIGGWSGDRVNTVYKGTHLQPHSYKS